MWPSLKPSQRMSVASTINPQSATTVQTTGWVSMASFQNIVAKINTGVITATGTVDAKLQQATDSSGTGAKDITGKAITQLVATTNNNQQCLINLKSDELDATNNFAYVRLSITPATAAALISGEIIGMDAVYGPGDLQNNAAVVQVI